MMTLGWRYVRSFVVPISFSFHQVSAADLEKELSAYGCPADEAKEDQPTAEQLVRP
jgi:hypothetical protein